MKEIKLLSLDQATGISGVAVFVDKKLIKYDMINLKKNKDTTSRFQEMTEKIEKWIENENPDIVIFEDVSLQSNISSLLLLARLQGTIMQICFANNIPFKIYKPTTWRKVLNFRQGNKVKRDELKQQSIDFVNDKYGVLVTDDISDAICIGEAYINNEFKGED